jgi:intracellular septation protein A
MAVQQSTAEFAMPEEIGVGAAIRRSGPRLLRDAFGPLVVFFAGWKLFGLGAGIVSAVIFGLAVFAHERRQGRPATVVRLALVLVAIRATVGLVSGSASAYLATEIGIDALLASTVLGSLATQRPFASWFAADIYPFPPEVLESRTYRAVMVRVTLVWGAYFLLRGAVRLSALLTLNTDSYALVVGLTDAPFLLGLLAWSVYYTIGAFRRSEDLGPLIAAAESR